MRYRRLTTVRTKQLAWNHIPQLLVDATATRRFAMEAARFMHLVRAPLSSVLGVYRLWTLTKCEHNAAYLVPPGVLEQLPSMPREEAAALARTAAREHLESIVSTFNLRTFTRMPMQRGKLHAAALLRDGEQSGTADAQACCACPSAPCGMRSAKNGHIPVVLHTRRSDACVRCCGADAVFPS